MRQWASVFLILIVIATMGAFTVGGIVAVVHATTVLQQSVAGVDDLTLAENLGECDPFDLSPCY